MTEQTYQGVSLLTDSLKTTLTHAGMDMVATIQDGALVVAGVAVVAIAFTVGLNYVLRKIRSVGSQAV